MLLTFTTPSIMGYVVFFETFNYTTAGKLLEWEKSEYDGEVGELWLLGKFHLVIGKK